MSATSTSEAEAELIPSLPNDMALNVLVRVPRAHHPILSLVSKSIRSLLSSPSFFTTRALLNTPEHFLYLTLRNPHPSSPHLWFTLHNNRRLVPVPPSPSLYIGSAYVALGPKVYVIGGSRNDVLYPHVWVLDCRFNKWEQAPNMRVPREFAAAGAVDGNIYIMGGCIVDTWARCRNWAEVFDPVIGQWETVASEIEVREKWMHACAVVDDKIYAMADRGGVVYDPRERQWGTVGKRLDLGWRGRACGIDGVLYCYDYLGKIRGFDLEQGVWKELKGVEKGLPKFLCGATMADLGGKLMVVWEGRKGNSSSGCNRKDMEIWCACLEVKKEGKELFGKIDWCNSVLKVPTGSSIVHCLAVAL